MTTVEVIRKYREEIEEALVNAYRMVLDNNGESQIMLYIWDDGEIEYMEDVQGGNSYYVPGSSASQDLHWIWTIDEPFFDPWDYADHPRPRSKAKQESERAEIINECVSNFASDVYDFMRMIIKEHKNFCYSEDYE